MFRNYPGPPADVSQQAAFCVSVGKIFRLIGSRSEINAADKKIMSILATLRLGCQLHQQRY
jgi:hypothetical protein